MDQYVNGVPLVVLVFGLVEFTRQLGLAGKALRVASMLIGVLLGVLYQLSLGVPATYAGWFGAVVFGLALGLTASGIFDWADKRFPKLEFITTSQPAPQDEVQ